jgi:hypothetical protein
MMDVTRTVRPWPNRMNMVPVDTVDPAEMEDLHYLQETLHPLYYPPTNDFDGLGFSILWYKKYDDNAPNTLADGLAFVKTEPFIIYCFGRYVHK